MSITIDATVENGVLKLAQPIDLPNGAQVRVTIDPASAEEQPADPLADVIGICDEGPEISLAERHDEFLYGLRKGAENG